MGAFGIPGVAILALTLDRLLKRRRPGTAAVDFCLKASNFTDNRTR